MTSTVIEKLKSSSVAVEREVAASLVSWQAAKRAVARKTSLGRLPGLINRHGCVNVVSSVVRRRSIGFQEVDPAETFEAIVDRHPELFEHEVVHLARQRLLSVAQAK